MNTAEEWYRKCLQEIEPSMFMLDNINVINTAKETIEQKGWSEQEKIEYWRGFYEYNCPDKEKLKKCNDVFPRHM